MSPKKFLLGEKKIRVKFRNGSYLNIYYHSKWSGDLGYNEKDGFIEGVYTKKRLPLCAICGGPWNMRYIIPYDGIRAPDHYCGYCRKKHSIMDIKDAKRHGKIL